LAARRLDVVFTPAHSPNEFETPFRARLQILGGEDREIVPFALSIVAEEFVATPLILSVNVPRGSVAEAGAFVVQRRAGDAGTEKEQPALSPLVLEVAQGTQTVQILPLMLPA